MERLKTLKNLNKFIEERLKVNADYGREEVTFDNPVCNELHAIRSVLTLLIEDAEKELDKMGEHYEN